MRTSFRVAVLLAVAVSAAAGSVAAGSLEGSSLAMPMVSLASVAGVGADATLQPTLALSTPFVGGVRYRPRRRHESYRPMPVTTQIHAGTFEPRDNFDTGFNAGFRLGPQLDENVQIGVGLDWWHKAERQTMHLGTVPVPGGSADAEIELSRFSADLVPLMAFVQVGGHENMAVIPYVGAAAGYEWLFLSADYPDGSVLEQTFGGFGWQVWAGAGIPLSGRTRLNGEVFYNGSEVESDVLFEDGLPATLAIDMDGVGLRIGLSWGF